MVTSRSLLVISGCILGLGQITTFSVGLSTCTYSSKLRVTLLVLNCRAEPLGVAVSSTGGSQSLGPPVGGMMLAHEVPIHTMQSIMQQSRSVAVIAFLIMYMSQ